VGASVAAGASVITSSVAGGGACVGVAAGAHAASINIKTNKAGKIFNVIFRAVFTLFFLIVPPIG
jgi:hypothetical protein